MLSTRRFFCKFSSSDFFKRASFSNNSCSSDIHHHHMRLISLVSTPTPLLRSLKVQGASHPKEREKGEKKKIFRKFQGALNLNDLQEIRVLLFTHLPLYSFGRFSYKCRRTNYEQNSNNYWTKFHFYYVYYFSLWKRVSIQVLNALSTSLSKKLDLYAISILATLSSSRTV